MSTNEKPQPDPPLQASALLDIKERLRQKAQGLLEARPDQVANIAQEIQVLRIAYRLFKEIEEGSIGLDDSLRDEMVLVTRMLKQGGAPTAVGGDGDGLEPAEDSSSLEAFGLSPAGAKVFMDVVSRRGPAPPVNTESDDEPEPDASHI